MIFSKLYDWLFKSHWVDCGTIAVVQKVNIVDEGYTVSVLLSYTILYNTKRNTFKINSYSSDYYLNNAESHKAYSIIRNDVLDIIYHSASTYLKAQMIKKYIRDFNAIK